MAKTYIDDCFDSTIPKRIRNIRIYMSIYDLDQNAVAKQIGYAKSTVSKNISFDATLSNSFAERFCSTYNTPLKYLDYPTTKFYSTILIEKRNKEIEETGDDPGELRDIELLKRYKYKFKEETIPKVVKKDEVIDTNQAKDAILYNKKMLYKKLLPYSKDLPNNLKVKKAHYRLFRVTLVYTRDFYLLTFRI